MGKRAGIDIRPNQHQSPATPRPTSKPAKADLTPADQPTPQPVWPAQNPTTSSCQITTLVPLSIDPDATRRWGVTALRTRRLLRAAILTGNATTGLTATLAHPGHADDTPALGCDLPHSIAKTETPELAVELSSRPQPPGRLPPAPATEPASYINIGHVYPLVTVSNPSTCPPGANIRIRGPDQSAHTELTGLTHQADSPHATPSPNIQRSAMSTETTTKRIPRFVIAGLACGFVAALLTILAVLYYTLVIAGALPDPPRGVSSIWLTAIVLTAMVPIGLWCAHVASRPTHARLDRIEERYDSLERTIQGALDQVSAEALEAARQSGRWEGVAQSLDGAAFPRTTADVVGIFDRERNRSVR